MVVCYAPLIVALLLVYIEQRNKLHPIIQQFIFLINIAFVVFLVYFIISNYSIYSDKHIDYVLVYTISTLSDTTILSLVTILILINIPTKLRYLFSIIFGMSLLSFMGIH